MVLTLEPASEHTGTRIRHCLTFADRVCFARCCLYVLCAAVMQALSFHWACRAGTLR
jgi:hypothetical protein